MSLSHSSAARPRLARIEIDPRLSSTSQPSSVSGLWSGSGSAFGSDAQHLLTPPDAAPAPHFEAIVWRRDSADGTWAAARAGEGSATSGQALWPDADKYAAGQSEVGLLEAKIGNILNLTPRLSAYLPPSPAPSQRSLPDVNVCPDDSPLLPASPPRGQGEGLSAGAIPPLALPSRAHTVMRTEVSVVSHDSVFALLSAKQETAPASHANDEEENRSEREDIPRVDKGKGRAMGERPQDLTFFPLPSSKSTTSLLSTSTSSSIRRTRGPPSIPSRTTSHRHLPAQPVPALGFGPESPARPPHAPPARISSLGVRSRSSTSGASARSVSSVVSDSSGVLPGSRSARSVTFLAPPLAIRADATTPRKRVVLRSKRSQSDTLPLPLERPAPSCSIPEPPRGATRVHTESRLGAPLRRATSAPLLGQSISRAPAATMQYPRRSKDDLSYSGGTVRSRLSMSLSGRAPASPGSPSAKLVKRAPLPPSPGSPFKAHARPSLFAIADMWQDRPQSREFAPRGIVPMAEPPTAAPATAPATGLAPSLSARALARLDLRDDFVPDILSEVEEADARQDRVRAMRAEDHEAVCEAEGWTWPVAPTHAPVSPRAMWARAVRASAAAAAQEDEEQDVGDDADADAKRVRDSLRSTTTSASLSSVASTALLTPSGSTSACIEDAFRLCVVPPDAEEFGAGPRTPTARHAMLDRQSAGLDKAREDGAGAEWGMEEVTPKASARAVGEKLYVPARRQAAPALVDSDAPRAPAAGRARTEPLRVVKKKSSTRGFGARGFLGAWGESGVAYF